jgi:predicted O-methyltransferase YrrM
MDKEEYCSLNVNRKISIDEVNLLKKYAQTVPENGLILDIGTCEGGSAFALAIGSKPSVRIVTIDPTPNPRFYMHRNALGFDDKIEIVTMESQKVNWNRDIDMFFNDGLHSHKGILEDNDIYCPYVKKNGLCLFHDFTLYNNTVGKGILDGEGKYYKKLEVIGNIYIGERL